jgi:hypothetical protein
VIKRTKPPPLQVAFQIDLAAARQTQFASKCSGFAFPHCLGRERQLEGCDSEGLLPGSFLPLAPLG